MTTEGWIINKSSSGGSSASESPKNNKIKFLCSQGGKILPKSHDGNLRYVGGETRIISVPRDIKFEELMKKLTYQIEGEMVLKYQLVPEDLDALITVRSDEDLSHMFDEYDRNENSGALKLRTFLFPTKPNLTENQSEIYTLEQRYVAAINGYNRSISPSSSGGTKQQLQRPLLSICRSSFATSPPDFCISSGPMSPESSYSDITINEQQIPNNYHHQSHHRGGQMYRVHSSPSITNMNGYLQTNNQSFQQQQQSYNNCYIKQPPPHHHGKPPVNGPERPTSLRSSGRFGSLRLQVDPVQNYHRYYGSSGSSSSDKKPEKKGCSLPPSPLSMSPRAQQNPNSFKLWDRAILE